MPLSVKRPKRYSLIITVYACLFILLVCFGIKGIIDDRKIHSAHRSIVAVSIQKIRTLREWRINSEQLQQLTERMVFHRDTIPAADQLLCARLILLNNAYFSRLLSLIETSDEKVKVNNLRNEWQKYLDSRLAFYEMRGSKEKARQFYERSQKARYDLIYSLVNELSETNYNAITQKETSLNRYLYFSRALGGLLILLVIIMLAILGILVMRTSKELRQKQLTLLLNERDLSDAKNMYKDLFDQCPYPKFVCDRNSFLFYEVNEAALELYGYSKEEFLHCSVYDLEPEDEHSSLDNLLRQFDFSVCAIKERTHVHKTGYPIKVNITLGEIVYKGRSCVLMTVNDITEKVKAEEEKRKLDIRFRALVENSHDGIALHDRRGTLLYASPSVEQILGYNKEDVLGARSGSFVHPADLPKLKEAVKNLGSRQTTTIEYRMRDARGQWIWLRSNITNMLEEKSIGALVFNYQDVTRYREADEKIRKEELFYRTITENSSDIQFISDEKGTIIFASPSAYTNFGYREDELIGKKREDFWHPEDVSSYHEKIMALVNNPGSTAVFEVRCLDHNKNYRWVEAKISNYLYNPVIRGFVSNYSDISERKKSEEQMGKSKEMYRGLFYQGPLPMMVVNKNNLNYLEVNDAAVELYGYSREEFLKMSVFDIRIREDHGQLDEFINHVPSGPFKNVHVRHRRKDGSIIVVDVTVDLMNYWGEDAFLAVIKDVSKIVQLQTQLQQERVRKQVEITKATINGQEKERTELAKELHDNVNQILATAKLFIEMAMRDKQISPDLLNNGKDLISSGIQEIRKISKSLLPPSLGKNSLKEALQDLLQPLSITKTDTSLRCDSLDECSLSEGLKISIFRIVQEQLNNILKYAEASRVCIEIEQTDQRLELRVCDDGKGFDVNQKSSGIGLMNIMNRASTYNGTMQVKSSPGNGCRLEVSFDLSREISFEDCPKMTGS